MAEQNTDRGEISSDMTVSKMETIVSISTMHCVKNWPINNEVKKPATVAKNATAQIEGNRKIIRLIDYYNLDEIISIGYHVNAKHEEQPSPVAFLYERIRI